MSSRVEERVTSLEEVLEIYIKNTEISFARLHSTIQDMKHEMEVFRVEIRNENERLNEKLQQQDEDFKEWMKQHAEENRKREEEYNEWKREHDEENRKREEKYEDWKRQLDEKYDEWKRQHDEEYNEWKREHDEENRQREEKYDEWKRQLDEEYNEWKREHDEENRQREEKFENWKRQHADENRKWMKQQEYNYNKTKADLSDSLGRLAEDFGAPNLPAIANRYFSCSGKPADVMIRRTRRINYQGKIIEKEFDLIVVYPGVVFYNETKLKARPIDIRRFIANTKDFFIYFPEYRDYWFIPIFGTLYPDPSIINSCNKRKIYIMAMQGNTMDIVNYNNITYKS